MNAIRTYATQEDLNATSPVMEHHQRHPRGNSIITEMFTRYFRVPQGFENLVYLSQVQQALAIRTAVEHWRRLQPTCMGTLYWQLNDNWPVCSWSSIDYTGTWKLLHYVARRFYAPVLLSGHVTGDRLEVWITNDAPQEARGVATLRVFDFDGALIHKEQLEAQVESGRTKLVKSWSIRDLADSPDKAFVVLSLGDPSGETTNEVFLTEPKRCNIAKAKVTLDCQQAEKGFSVTLRADKPAFFVSLSAAEMPGEFSDNCFTLLPQEPRVIAFQPRRQTTLKRLARALSVKHLRDTF